MAEGMHTECRCCLIKLSGQYLWHKLGKGFVILLLIDHIEPCEQFRIFVLAFFQMLKHLVNVVWYNFESSDDQG